jgi:hypothetical protein
MVTVRCGPAFRFGVEIVGGAAGVAEVAACEAAGLAVGEGVEPGFGFCGGGPEKKKVHKNSIAEESSKASKSRFCCIVKEVHQLTSANLFNRIVSTRIERVTPKQST